MKDFSYKNAWSFYISALERGDNDFAEEILEQVKEVFEEECVERKGLFA